MEKENMSQQRRKDEVRIAYTGGFCRILDFFLIKAPAKNMSRMGKSFQELGWAGSSRFQMLERILKESVRSSPAALSEWLFCAKNDVAEHSHAENDVTQYVIVGSKHEKMTELFHSIRCALAHGSFKVKTIDKKTLYYADAEINPSQLSTQRTLYRVA